MTDDSNNSIPESHSLRTPSHLLLNHCGYTVCFSVCVRDVRSSLALGNVEFLLSWCVTVCVCVFHLMEVGSGQVNEAPLSACVCVCVRI